MGECAFGRGFGSVAPDTKPEAGFDEAAWKKIPHVIFDGLRKRYMLVYVKRTLRRLGINIKFDWPASMVRAIDSVIARRQKDEKNERTDLLQHLLDKGHRPDNGVKMNTRDILDQLSELTLAGAETTSATICYLFMELARNPDVRKKLLSTLPTLSLQDPLIDSISVRTDPAFEYLQACIQENLRMHPIASEFGRRTKENSIVLDGHVIPPYTVVSASYRALHLNEEHWPQADRFWPERFLAEDHPMRGDAPAAEYVPSHSFHM
jgi:cytochrome P450